MVHEKHKAILWAFCLLVALVSIARAAQPIELFDSTGPSSIQFSPDSRLLVRAYSRGTVTMWNIQRRQPEGEPLQIRPEGQVRGIFFSEKARMMAVEIAEGVAKRRIEFFSWPEKRLLRRFSSMERGFCQFSRSGTLLMMKPFGRDITLYQLEPQQPPRMTACIKGSQSVPDAILAPEADIVACANSKMLNSIDIWSVSRSDVCCTVCPAPPTPRLDPPNVIGVDRLPLDDQYFTNQFLFTPDGRSMITCTRGPQIDQFRMSAWDTKLWTRNWSIRFQCYANSGMIAVSPDSSLLAVTEFTHANGSGKISERSRIAPIALIDLRTHKFKCWCKCEPKTAVVSLVFSPDGKYLAAWMTDPYVRIWTIDDVLRGE